MGSRVVPYVVLAVVGLIVIGVGVYVCITRKILARKKNKALTRCSSLQSVCSTVATGQVAPNKSNLSRAGWSASNTNDKRKALSKMENGLFDLTGVTSESTRTDSIKRFRMANRPKNLPPANVEAKLICATEQAGLQEAGGIDQSKESLKKQWRGLFPLTASTPVYDEAETEPISAHNPETDAPLDQPIVGSQQEDKPSFIKPEDCVEETGDTGLEEVSRDTVAPFPGPSLPGPSRPGFARSISVSSNWKKDGIEPVLVQFTVREEDQMVYDLPKLPRTKPPLLRSTSTA